MDWQIHQEVHRAERDALKDLGIPGNAFDRAYGNVENTNNLPARRQYDNIPGRTW